jgi:hypothetical protein
MVFAIVYIAHPSFPKNDHASIQGDGGLNISLETFVSAAMVLLVISVDRYWCAGRSAVVMIWKALFSAEGSKEKCVGQRR